MTLARQDRIIKALYALPQDTRMMLEDGAVREAKRGASHPRHYDHCYYVALEESLRGHAYNSALPKVAR